jgi:NAD+ synthase
VLLSINGSPYEVDKPSYRIQLALNRVVETGLPFVFCAQVCGQDELVFDGGSFVLNADHALAVQMPFFEEAITLTEWTRADGHLVCAPQELSPEPPRLEAIYRSMMLGLGDYVRKNRFPGGIDSALSAAVAVDALGPGMVRTFMLPSPYTSEHSLEDAAECARLLGIPCDSVSIEPAMRAFSNALEPVFNGRQADITEENIQSRSRGLILMAISNKLGHMVLTTGNKSEMSVGYATLYGDMAGGFAPIKDCSKQLVYRLARWRNQRSMAIPARVIERPPSAELRYDQKDTDSLPPYEVLDPILEAFIEEDLSVDQIVARGFDRATVGRILDMVKRNEYKRRQAPPGVRVSGRAFGRDWRYPITSGYRSR